MKFIATNKIWENENISFDKFRKHMESTGGTEREAQGDVRRILTTRKLSLLCPGGTLHSAAASMTKKVPDTPVALLTEDEASGCLEGNID